MNPSSMKTRVLGNRELDIPGGFRLVDSPSTAMAECEDVKWIEVEFAGQEDCRDFYDEFVKALRERRLVGGGPQRGKRG